MSATTNSLDQWIKDFRRKGATLEIYPVDCRAEEMREPESGDIEEFNGLVRIMQDKSPTNGIAGGETQKQPGPKLPANTSARLDHDHA